MKFYTIGSPIKVVKAVKSSFFSSDKAQKEITDKAIVKSLYDAAKMNNAVLLFTDREEVESLADFVALSLNNGNEEYIKFPPIIEVSVADENDVSKKHQLSLNIKGLDNPLDIDGYQTSLTNLQNIVSYSYKTSSLTLQLTKNLAESLRMNQEENVKGTSSKSCCLIL